MERGLSRRVEQRYTSLSIDEKSFRKGHHYVTVLSCPQTGTIINVAEGRTKKVSKELITNSLTETQRAIVETVSMDMSRAYIML